MSFYTSLTGLNAAQAQLGITSNNVSNVGTVGFKKSRAEFGDIFATSPLENASSAIGQGVLLKKVNQQFSQGNIEFSTNSLDLAISGQGFFALKPSQTSNQTVYTRAGSFSVNNDRYVVDSSGQYLQTFPVNDDGSVIATGLGSAKSLQLPSTAGLPQPSSQIELGLNLPAGADILPEGASYTVDNPYAFDRNDSDTFNKSTSITVFDSLGNPHIATVYYIKTSSATEINPTNKWDTKIFIGDNELDPSIIAAKNDKSETQYMNKFGQISTNPAAIDPTFNAAAAHPLYFNDDQQTTVPSSPGRTVGGYMTRATVGHDFGSTDSNKVTIVNPTKEVDTFTFDQNLAAGGSVTFAGGSEDYTQPFITSHNATLDALVNTINATETAFKAARVDSKVVLTAYTSAALPTMSVTGNASVTTSGGVTSTVVLTNSLEHTAAAAGWPAEGSGSFSGTDFVSVSVDGSDSQSIDIAAGTYSGTELATLMTLNLNAKFSDEKSYKMPASTADRTITLELQDSNGNDINKDNGPEIDTYTYADQMVLGGTASFAIASGSTYTQNFETNHRDTLDALATKINVDQVANKFVVKRVDDSLVLTATSTTIALPVIDSTGGTYEGSTPVAHSKVETASATGTSDLTIVVDQYQDNTTNFTREELVANVQSKVDAVTYIGDDDVAHTGLPLTVGYDLTTRSLTFTAKTDVYDGIYTSVKASSPSTVSAFGLDSATATFSAVGDAFMGGQIVPTGAVSLDAKQQRQGLLVTYSKDAHKFSFSSGSTGEASTINVGVPAGTNLTGGTSHLLGIGATYNTEVSNTVGTGLASTPGTVQGSKAGVDITGTFSVTANDNTISVTIDGVDGTVVVPPAAYTGHTFATAIEDRVNLIQHADGRQVNDVSVVFDQTSQSFTVTSGTVGASSSVNINGHSNWGFDTTTQIRGTVPQVTVVTQATDAEGNLLYIDQAGKQTTQKPDTTPSWTPIYLDKGELTFDTYGKLISPKEGVAYSPFDPSNGSDLLTLGVDYGKFSTQYSAPFSVLSLSQDGYPSGQLDGLDIDSGGVVRANYTNGTQVALGKLMMANFANPNGLKQVGNANFKSTTNSGAADLGEAGSDGFGAIQGGALERANVDLTEELVALITAQRNFQANAKAIETSSSLTQTIINIRG
ncbi:flagellar hook-basal body complex protein [Oceanospirillaceae bacterium]|nr:flagellar hook-basal body complex protein [Oceanospirillaceae bacterium]